MVLIRSVNEIQYEKILNVNSLVRRHELDCNHNYLVQKLTICNKSGDAS